MPFTVLHVCVGNICRSPMAERLLAAALRRQVGDAMDDMYLSHGAGTGSWHIGEPMNSPAARQLLARGAVADGFEARKLNRDHIEASHLILCATSQQVSGVLSLCPDAVARTFVLGEFGRLLADVDLGLLPALPAVDHVGAHARGVALVAAVDGVRSDPKDPGWRRRSRDDDDLRDPWGMPDSEFAAVADAIERTVVPLAAALVPARSPAR